MHISSLFLETLDVPWNEPIGLYPIGYSLISKHTFEISGISGNPSPDMPSNNEAFPYPVPYKTKLVSFRSELLESFVT